MHFTLLNMFFYEHSKLSKPASGISRVNDSVYLQCVRKVTPNTKNLY